MGWIGMTMEFEENKSFYYCRRGHEVDENSPLFLSLSLSLIRPRAAALPADRDDHRQGGIDVQALYRDFGLRDGYPQDGHTRHRLPRGLALWPPGAGTATST